MGVTTYKRSSNVKNFGNVQIDWGNPLTKDLIAAWFFYEGGGGTEDLVSHYRLLPSNSNYYWTTGLSGPCFTGDGSLNNAFQSETPYAIVYKDPNWMSMAARVRKSSATAVEGTIYAPASSAGALRLDISRNVDGDIGVIQTSVAAIAVTSASVLTNGVWTNILYTASGFNTSNNTIYVNAIPVSLTTSGLLNASNAGVKTQLIGQPSTLASDGTQFPGEIDYVAIWQRPLSQNEAQMLVINPYVMLKPAMNDYKSNLFSPAQAGGSARYRTLMGLGI